MMRILWIPVLLAALLLLTACGSDVEIIQNAQQKAFEKEQSEKAEQMSGEILRCFTQKDREALYELFCPQIQARPELNGELDEALAFFICDAYADTDSCVITGSGISGEDDQSKVWYVLPEIPYIRVLYDADGDPATPAENRYFSLRYTWYIENDEEPSLEGLQCITVELLNVGSVQIGEEMGS